jgi:outer membrane lipoprotein SlyB
MARMRSTTQTERRIRFRDTLGLLMSDTVDAVMGGLAGGAAGLIAGPTAMIVGASLGFVAGFACGHHANREQHERELHIQELDDIDRDISLHSMRTLPIMSARNY